VSGATGSHAAFTARRRRISPRSSNTCHSCNFQGLCVDVETLLYFLLNWRLEIIQELRIRSLLFVLITM